MRVRTLILALVAAAIIAPRAQAAPDNHYWWFTPMAGYQQFSDKLHYPEKDSLADVAVYGVRIGHDLGHRFGAEIGGWVAPTKEAAGQERWVGQTGGAFSLMYSLLQRKPGDLYLAAGWGVTSHSADNFKRQTRTTFEQAIGWRGWFNDNFGYRLEARNLLSLRSNNLAKSDQNDQQYWAGLTWPIGGKQPDTDGDGVSDKKDKCPNTPVGAKVDATGCPIDSDHDGVPDGIDQCPNTPAGAVVDARGCPKDSDGDGVYDGIDQCPDTPHGAKVDAKGCPIDSDHDGVPDGIDQCPNTPNGAHVDANGCPTDSDGDGVYDGLDKCPDTPAGAKVDADGCPIVVTERETELFDTGMIRLQNVNFETNKADLMPESLPILDEVGPILRKWPQLQIEVGGHTDSRGTAAKNQVLSDARANAVRDYLLKKFPSIEPTQLTAKGYGLTRPIAPNNNALNMAKNRRVEFVVLNKDVLKKEVEKRKLLQK